MNPLAQGGFDNIAILKQLLENQVSFRFKEKASIMP